MRSDIPKGLHALAGRPVLLHVLHALRDGGLRRVIVVTGHGAEQVEAAIAADGAGGPRCALRAAAGAAGHRARGPAGPGAGSDRRGARRQRRSSAAAPPGRVRRARGAALVPDAGGGPRARPERTGPRASRRRAAAGCRGGGGCRRRDPRHRRGQRGALPGRRGLAVAHAGVATGQRDRRGLPDRRRRPGRSDGRRRGGRDRRAGRAAERGVAARPGARGARAARADQRRLDGCGRDDRRPGGDLHRRRGAGRRGQPAGARHAPARRDRAGVPQRGGTEQRADRHAHRRWLRAGAVPQRGRRAGGRCRCGGVQHAARGDGARRAGTHRHPRRDEERAPASWRADGALLVPGRRRGGGGEQHRRRCDHLQLRRDAEASYDDRGGLLRGQRHAAGRTRDDGRRRRHGGRAVVRKDVPAGHMAAGSAGRMRRRKRDET